MHSIYLYNILYISINYNNLFSLSYWIIKGGNFSNHKLALILKDGNLIANRTLTQNNLIKLHFCYTKQDYGNDLSKLTLMSSFLQCWIAKDDKFYYMYILA